MTITLKQFKKFANDNDILWFYNKPKWRVLPGGRMSGKRYTKDLVDELRKMWLDSNALDALPYIEVQDDDIIDLSVSMEESPLINKLTANKDMIIANLVQNQINLNNQKEREETMKVNLEIAKICHQVNRDYCIDEQIEAPPKWDEVRPDIQEGIVAGVALVIADPGITPTELHFKWCEYKEAQDWSRGEVKDFEEKTHPNLVKFKNLPDVEKRKVVMFLLTVKREMKA